MWRANVSVTSLCLSVCLSVFNALIFESQKVHFWYPGTSSEYLGQVVKYVKVVWSRSRSQEPKRVGMSCLRVVCLRLLVLCLNYILLRQFRCCCVPQLFTAYVNACSNNYWRVVWWLVHCPSMGGLIHLVQYKGALQLKPFLLNVLINTVKSQSTKFIVIRQASITWWV